MASVRLPMLKDFSSNITLTITPPPLSQTPVNAIILLHGLGDTHTPFTNLARQLSLPYTVIISLCAPTPVPALITGSDAPSFHWGDDVLFDQQTGGLDMDSGFRASGAMLEAVLRILKEECGFRERDVGFLGYGQGGMAALFFVCASPAVEYNGVISIGGRLSDSCSVATTGKAKTPILILGGSSKTEITKPTIEKIKAVFGDVEYVKWKKAGDGMPSSREEMLPLMRFWSRRLGSRAGVPEAAVQVEG